MTEEATDVGGVSGERIKAYLDRVELLEEEKKGMADDISEIWTEAKDFGFDVKTMKQIVKLRRMDTEKRREADALLEVYKTAIGLE